MYSQLQTRYPTASLVSELLQIQNGHFVVRVVVQVGGITLTTGMAASLSIEQAEDQARLRALAVLGIYPTADKPQSLIGQPDSASGRLDGVTPDSGVSSRLLPAQESFKQSFSEPRLLNRSTPEVIHSQGPTDSTQLPTADLLSQAYPDLDSAYAASEGSELESEAIADNRGSRFSANSPERNRSPQGNNGKAASGISFGPQPEGQNGRSVVQRTKPAPQTGTLQAPIDLSDTIAQTSVELKRLGWSDVQGRNYLQQTYGKRSRSSLTDEELLEFLQYLQAQPSTDEPFF